MKLEVVTPADFMGNIQADLNPAARPHRRQRAARPPDGPDGGGRAGPHVRLLDARPQPVAGPGLVLDGAAEVRLRPAVGAGGDVELVL